MNSIDSDENYDSSANTLGTRVSTRKTRRILAYLKRPVMATFTVILLDLIGILLITRTLPRTTLALVILLEGSTGLLAGAGIVLSSTPSISKIGEITIGSASWSREGERHAERIAGKWIIASSLMILIGFALSMI
jgi:hypothetical protein